jgi:hypothetical protein
MLNSFGKVALHLKPNNWEKTRSSTSRRKTMMPSSKRSAKLGIQQKQAELGFGRVNENETAAEPGASPNPAPHRPMDASLRFESLVLRSHRAVGPGRCADSFGAMKARLFAHVCLLCSILTTGCYRLPKQSGAWIGSIEAQTLYDARGYPNRCALFQISAGPALKDPNSMPTRYLMVDRKMASILPEALGFTNATVRGTIISDHAKVSTPGQIIVGSEPGKPWAWPYVIRVRYAEPTGCTERRDRVPADNPKPYVRRR